MLGVCCRLDRVLDHVGSTIKQKGAEGFLAVPEGCFTVRIGPDGVSCDPCRWPSSAQPLQSDLMTTSTLRSPTPVPRVP